jgi:altronate hydrolase
MGDHLLEEVKAVAAGKLTASERLGHTELHMHYMVQKQRKCE